MNNAITVLKDKYSAGLYQVNTEVNIDELSNWCQAQNFRFFHIDGQAVKTKIDFLCVIAQVMNFPTYFGNNWDAFEECMADLEWCKSQGYVLLYTHPEHFAQHEPAQWTTAIAIFQSTIAHWQKAEVPMYIFLTTHGVVSSELEIL